MLNCLADRYAARKVAWKRIVGGPKQPATRPHCAGYFLRRAGVHGAPPRLHEKDPEDTATRYRSSAQTKEGNAAMKKKNIGSTLDSMLREDGIYEEVSAAAIKRVLARQVEAAMKEKHVSKAEMARRMHTSRAALDRLLDPDYDAVTLSTLRKAATAVGRELRLELV